MQTREWGPKLWDYAFIMNRNYPVKINEKDTRHRGIKTHYRAFYMNLQHTLPCKYCRMSYKRFIKELPIDKYLNSRTDITYWLYLLKDKVNKKLIKQEKKLLKKEIAKLSNPSKETIDKLEKKLLYTVPSPPFADICDKYEKYRAKCGKIKGRIESCRVPDEPQTVKLNKKKYNKKPL